MHDGSRPRLTRTELTARFGADAASLRTVERWAKRERLEIVESDLLHRSVELRGSTARLARLFGVEPTEVVMAERRWLGHGGAIHLPRVLSGAVSAVLGFEQRPLAGRGTLPPDRERRAAPSRVTGRSFSAPEIAALYGFPREVDGSGQTVGVIALGGGYRRRDLDEYFRTLALPRPRFTAVSVHGARNAPRGTSSQFDGEVTGDIETVGGLAPGAHVVVYFAPNTERGFLGAVARAVHDRKHRPTVLSVSWGRDERLWKRSTLRAFEEVLAEAVALGITVCCSSGDDGAYAQPGETRPCVCYPASSPHVLACGGTSLLGTRPGRIRECGWKDAKGASGGGVSVIFARPDWQTTPVTPRESKHSKGRCLPDVAANADPESGYQVCVEGKWHVGAGTSAAAPLWAGLVARINQLHDQPIGLFTPFLYRHLPRLVRRGAIRQIRTIEGERVVERAGWNRHTGLGVPGGARLAAAILRWRQRAAESARTAD